MYFFIFSKTKNKVKLRYLLELLTLLSPNLSIKNVYDVINFVDHTLKGVVKNFQLFLKIAFSYVRIRILS